MIEFALIVGIIGVYLIFTSPMFSAEAIVCNSSSLDFVCMLSSITGGFDMRFILGSLLVAIGVATLLVQVSGETR